MSCNHVGSETRDAVGAVHAPNRCMIRSWNGGSLIALFQAMFKYLPLVLFIHLSSSPATILHRHSSMAPSALLITPILGLFLVLVANSMRLYTKQFITHALGWDDCTWCFNSRLPYSY